MASQTRGQVCDRCRRRKIRCYGGDHECSSCISAGVLCMRSTQLQRNRKRKSYYESERTEQRRPGPGSQTSDGSPSAGTNDEATTAYLLPPQSQSDFSGLRPPVPGRSQAGNGAGGGASRDGAGSSSTRQSGVRPSTSVMSPSQGSLFPPGAGRPSANGNSRPAAHAPAAQTTKPTPEPVIGHMGRLVSDDRNVAMFSGSTTGVHFVSQAEQQVQMLQIHGDMFPGCAYGLHLHDLWGGASAALSSRMVPDDTDLIRAAVARMPPDATDVIEAAIDRWTPIYPIVHKPTTMEGVRELIDKTNSSGSSPSHPPALPNNAIVILYQALGLLALGTVGRPGGQRAGHDQCERDHRHLLCSSDVYYSMMAAVLDKVLEKPCLQTLQGLEIIQVYLQVSSRHTVASHMGGIATRMAQSLGLHRHSHRFKFDPLETELRRRAWWCQFSLDTFSSAYHGLPRLIRDQDVDTDLPTSTDDNLVSRTHVALPLPGERSQVDSALCLFKLARILGEALENLYTTTRRRGGVDKISRLDAELDMWQRALPDEAQQPFGAVSSDGSRGGGESSTATGVGGGRDVVMTDYGGGGYETGNNVDADAPSGGGGSSNSSFAATFLRVALCIARIHIHRPALSFTGPSPQFALSLRACVGASTELIKMLSAGLEMFDVQVSSSDVNMQHHHLHHHRQPHPRGLLVTLLYPSGAHMLWQAGLTILYSRWQKKKIWGPPGHPRQQGAAVQFDDDDDDDDDGPMVADQNEEELVRRCAVTLRRLRDGTGASGSRSNSAGGRDEKEEGGVGRDQLAQCADVLDILREKTWTPRPTEKAGSEDDLGLEVRQQREHAQEEGESGAASVPSFAEARDEQQQQQQLSWNIWDWPMESALELANSMDAAPLDLFLEAEHWFV